MCAPRRRPAQSPTVSQSQSRMEAACQQAPDRVRPRAAHLFDLRSQKLSSCRSRQTRQAKDLRCGYMHVVPQEAPLLPPPAHDRPLLSGRRAENRLQNMLNELYKLK